MLEETDSWFAVHNFNELGEVKDVNRVWYFCLGLDLAELERLFDLGVRNFVVELEDDLEKLIGFFEGRNKEINLMLRMKLFFCHLNKKQL